MANQVDQWQCRKCGAWVPVTDEHCGCIFLQSWRRMLDWDLTPVHRLDRPTCYRKRGGKRAVEEPSFGEHHIAQPAAEQLGLGAI